MLRDDHQTTSGLVEAFVGVDALGASGKSPLMRSRYNADGTFSKVNIYASHYRDLGGRFGLFVSAKGQWTNEPLLLSEQFGIGGLSYGRAYDFGELTGDSGIAGQVELRANLTPNHGPLSLLQAYAFLEGGRVWYENAAYHPGPYSLSAGGVGARMRVGDNILINSETAKPLSRTPFGQDDKDLRQSFSVSVDY